MACMLGRCEGRGGESTRLCKGAVLHGSVALLALLTAQGPPVRI